MYSLIFATLRVLTWWAYLGLAVLTANLTYGGYQSIVAQRAEAERAIRSGLPSQIDAGSYAPDRVVNPLDEVHLRGIIRADLGIGQIGEAGSGKPYIVLDDETGRGALVAVVFASGASQRDLSQFVAGSDATGRVIVTGFARSLNRSDVRGQLLVQGEMREVYLVEPYLGDRAQALRDRAERDLVFIYFGAAVAALLGLIGAWRFYRWRSRVAGRKLARPAVASPPQTKWPVQQTVANRTKPAPAATPWGPSAAGTPLPVTQARQDRKPIGKMVPDEKAVSAVINTVPAFKSVFPGGGSAFRFKTADEIIRERFGTLSVLSKPVDPSAR